MTNIDFTKLFQSMVTAATGAAKGHADDLKEFIENQVRISNETLQAIVQDRLKKKITAQEAKDSLKDMYDSARAAADAVEVTVLAAAQDAINAALKVATDAIQKAIGLTVL
jgi:hypothetical protein